MNENKEETNNRNTYKSRIYSIAYFISNTQSFMYMIISFLLILLLLMKDGYENSKSLIDTLITSNIALLIPTNKKD